MICVDTQPFVDQLDIMLGGARSHGNPDVAAIVASSGSDCPYYVEQYIIDEKGGMTIGGPGIREQE
jgi:hypothetical protein